MSELYDPLFGDSRVDAVFTPAATVRALLDVEVALAAAEAALGLVPRSAALAIEAAVQAGGIDAADLAREAAAEGNVVIPLVRALKAKVRATSAAGADAVHLGATSQDILDTALVLQLRAANLVIGERVDGAVARARELAERHAGTPIAGRTWLQHATPTSFGLKAAGWADLLARCGARLAEATDRAAVVSLGGASGTLAGFGGRGIEVAAGLGKSLGLRIPVLPWHTERDRLAEVAGALGILAGALGKIGRDVGLLAQTEVAEVEEGRPGGSSAMPHKRNPVRAAVAIAAATRAPGLVATMLSAMPQEHERSLGLWPAEWETLPGLVRLVGGAARAVQELLAELIVHPDRMAANLTGMGALSAAESIVTALTPTLGADAARALVTRVAADVRTTGGSLRQALEKEPTASSHLDPATLDRLFDPDHALGEARELIRRAREASDA